MVETVKPRYAASISVMSVDSKMRAVTGTAGRLLLGMLVAQLLLLLGSEHKGAWPTRVTCCSHAFDIHTRC
jgi:hypothetical protein